MNPNPYETPNRAANIGSPLLLCSLLSWCTAVTAVVLFVIAAGSALSNYSASTQMTVGSIPTFVIVATFVLFVCSGVLIFATITLRRHQWGRSAISVGLVLVVLFAIPTIFLDGPWALIRNMFGLPL